MTMQIGQTVYLAFSTPYGSDGKPVAFVRESVVIDAENRILRATNGYVTVLQDWKSETVHATEAEAWAACHARLSADAAAISEAAAECAAKAAAARIVAVPA